MPIPLVVIPRVVAEAQSHSALYSDDPQELFSDPLNVLILSRADSLGVADHR